MHLQLLAPLRLQFVKWQFQVSQSSSSSSSAAASVSSAVSFVPSHRAPNRTDIDHLTRFIDSSTKLFVLTGAGISTESGIPDYRSAHVGLYARNGYRPMTHTEFISRHSARRRYWARSYLSWPHFFAARPNSGHLALVRLQRHFDRSRTTLCCVTQNVDRLHQKAGMESVIELHGSLYTVKCLRCDRRIPRILLQQMLTELNRELLAREQSLELRQIVSGQSSAYQRLARPDGDIDLNMDTFVREFRFPHCDACGEDGILKPDVIFFGDNVSVELVRRIYDLVDESDSLLVLGSSVHVFSSFRFVIHAHKTNKNILLVNIGETRADSLPNVRRIDAKIGDILNQNAIIN